MIYNLLLCEISILNSISNIYIYARYIQHVVLLEAILEDDI